MLKFIMSNSLDTKSIELSQSDTCTNVFYITSTPTVSNYKFDFKDLNGNTGLFNDKISDFANSFHIELEKIINLTGKDVVEDLVLTLVLVLEALNTAWKDKETVIVENELLKEDYEKLLKQYEREKRSRKENELVIFINFV